LFIKQSSLTINIYLNYSAGTTSVATLPPASGPGAAQGRTSVAAQGTTAVATVSAIESVATFSVVVVELPPQAHNAISIVAIIKIFFIVFD
jgi:hypothetical protein